ncbi:MAG TPA: two-component regulator propeller domain-containing protein [Vicinamibacterales bacterium]|nr:two-component regulator propeller domain-containing protein [Vicinamibacterales bacterium]
MTWADTLERATLAQRMIALVVALVCGPRAYALDVALDLNQYAHTAWPLREGFAQGQVTAIAQTPDGYLWLGTEFGVLRFDGVRSVPWYPPGNEQLPNRWIRSLLAARDGTVWIGTLKGLASWMDGRLTQYPQLAGHSVNTLLVDHEGTVWAGGYAGPTGRLCAIKSGNVQCEGSGFGQWVGSLYEDSGHTLWATAQTGLWRWRPGTPTHYPMPDSSIGYSQALNENDDGKLLIVAEDGIRQLVEGKGVAYPLPGARSRFKPERLLQDRDGGLWIGTLDRGLLHVHQGRTDVYAQANGLSGDFVTRIFEDREGNIWVATKNGLDIFRNLTVRTISTNQGLPSAPPWSVLAARNGSVWLGTLGGLSRWNGGRVTIFRPAGNRSATGVRREAGSGGGREIFDSGLPDDGVGTLFEDESGRLWVATLRGVAYFENGRFIPVSLPAGRTSSIGGDSAGNLWIANEARGLYRLRGERVVEQIPWNKLKIGNPVTALLPDPKQGGLWLGLEGHVTYVEDGEIRASYTAVDGLAEGRVNDLRFDGSGALWVAMETGLSHVKGGRVVTLSRRNGLPCDSVHWIMEDDDQSVWLYTVCGLVRIASTELNAAVSDPTRAMQTTVFDGSDGVGLRVLPSVYRPQVAKTADGKLWFLPGDGVSVVDPRHLPINTLPPAVRIEQVTADRKTYDTASDVRLPPLVRNLEIDYTALSFVAPEKNHFRVKLEGRDPDWQDVGNRRQAFYADLSPGTYRFRVMASNNSGVWNEAGAFMDLSIAPAYYQTSWFRLASVVTVLVVLVASHQLRLRQIARDFNMRLDERVNERTRIARELHDTLLQSFQGLMLRFQSARDLLPAQPARAVEALDGALDRADQAIAEGRDAIQNLRSSTVVGNELSLAITTLAEELKGGTREKSSAIFRMSVEGSPRDLHPIVRDDIHRIAREALRNAFRHAQANRIEAEVTYGPRELRLRIRDDGKGIEPQHLSSGRARHWGLAGMRERAVQIGAQLSLWSEVGAGTEVELRISGAVAYSAPSGGSGRRGSFRMSRKEGSGS